ncbi:MAG: transcriptional repressor LexA [Treponema sp.]|jgi:repressor LexA|nr:transcriptional repressor LexA [Treponema sp.]
MKELTGRQKEVLSFIAKFIRAHSYPPTIREIAESFSISVKGAHDHITALKKKGFLRQVDKRSRTMELVKSYGEEEDSDSIVHIPLLGTVAAGRPLMAEENFNGTIPLYRSMMKKNRKYFALTVKGDSMSGVGIMDGDTAIIEEQSIVRNGEIAVAVIDDAATLKRFFRETTRIRLQPENPSFGPIYCQEVRIAGRLAGIIRQY